MCACARRSPTQRRLDPAVEANLNAKYHLDQPQPVQFAQYILGLLHGDLGLSFTNPGFSVQEVIGRGLGATVQLGVLAAGLAVLLGVPLGVLAALKQNSLADYGSMFFAIVGYTTPSFVLGIFLIVLFAVHWHALPPGGWGKPAAMIMPVVTLAAAPTAILARYTRGSMLDIRDQDYVRTAHAKGLAERTVVFRHMLRNALLPIITVLGPVVAALVTGSFIVETVFRVPGVGRLYINAIFARDYPLIMGTTLLYAVAVAVFNLVVAMLYVVVDPRITYE
jgi:oligopeptide transport system permease protein